MFGQEGQCGVLVGAAQLADQPADAGLHETFRAADVVARGRPHQLPQPRRAGRLRPMFRHVDERHGPGPALPQRRVRLCSPSGNGPGEYDIASHQLVQHFHAKPVGVVPVEEQPFAEDRLERGQVGGREPRADLERQHTRQLILRPG